MTYSPGSVGRCDVDEEMCLTCHRRLACPRTVKSDSDACSVGMARWRLESNITGNARHERSPPKTRKRAPRGLVGILSASRILCVFILGCSLRRIAAWQLMEQGYLDTWPRARPFRFGMSSTSRLRPTGRADSRVSGSSQAKHTTTADGRTSRTRQDGLYSWRQIAVGRSTIEVAPIPVPAVFFRTPSTHSLREHDSWLVWRGKDWVLRDKLSGRSNTPASAFDSQYH